MNALKRLYEVEITVRAVVVADNDNDAWHVACNNRRDIVGEADLDCDVVCEIQSAKDLPEGWNPDCLPYGVEDDRRISDYLADLPPAPDTKTIDMFKVQP